MTTAEAVPLALVAARRRLLQAGTDGDPLTMLARVDRAADDLAQLTDRARAALPALLDSTAYGGRSQHSCWSDLLAAHLGDHQAAARLDYARRVRQAVAELRDIGSGALNGLVPPAALPGGLQPAARSAAPVAAWLTQPVPLPTLGMALTVPRVTTAATAAAQSSQTTALTESDPATTPAADAIATIGARVDLSRQLLERATPGTDLLVSVELASALAAALELQVLAGSGTSGDLTGLLTVSGTGSVTATGTSDGQGAGLLATIGKLCTTYAGTSKQQPDALVMAPRRWQHLAYQSTSNGYPALSDPLPTDPAGTVGRIAGVPVIVSGSVPLDLGAGTNEDRIIAMRASDAALYVSEPEVTILSAGLATVTLQITQAAALPILRPASLTIVSGTSLALTL